MSIKRAWVAKWLIFPLVFLLVFLPQIALAFFIVLIAASLSWFAGFDSLSSVVVTGWWVYAGFGLYSFAFFTTFAFQNCCVGFESFRAHLVHRGMRGVFEDVFDSVFWPLAWLRLDAELKEWGMTLADALFNALMYWFVDSWRGIRVTKIDGETGKAIVTRAKSADDLRQAIVDALKEGPPKK